MMGFLSSLFSSKKAVDSVPETAAKIVDGVISGVDKLFFTDEEKAEVSQKAMDSIYDFIKSTIGENSIRSITRRRLAVMIAGAFLFLLILGGLVFPYDKEWSAYLLDCAKALSGLVLAVSVFYFGPYQVGGMITAIRGKKGAEKASSGRTGA